MTVEQAILEDGIDAVGNMIAAENHILEVARTSQQTEVFVVADEMRKQRQLAQVKLFGNKADDSNKKRDDKSELHCFFKHLLLARVCLKEVAQKHISNNDYEQAKVFLDLANEMYGMIQVTRGGYGNFSENEGTRQENR